jgi:REP element-mobilizing transposase RayT
MEARASSPAQNSHVYSICVNRKYDYRRKLPHLQPDRKLFFVTFGTHKRWILPPVARDIVLESCLYAHSKRFLLHAVVVMPDHVHLVFMPLSDSAGSFSIPEIMQAIKSFSAHRINSVLKRRGKVWQDESFDRALRKEQNRDEKIQYMCENPTRAGLVGDYTQYRWLWINGAVVQPTCTGEDARASIL